MSDIEDGDDDDEDWGQTLTQIFSSTLPSSSTTTTTTTTATTRPTVTYASSTSTPTPTSTTTHTIPSTSNSVTATRTASTRTIDPVVSPHRSTSNANTNRTSTSHSSKRRRVAPDVDTSISLSTRVHGEIAPAIALRDTIDCARSVLSLDIDCFYAQAETLRHPHLKGTPVGVRQKNLVITSNYEARQFGINKGDSLGLVKKKCPAITICNGENLNYYRVVSHNLFALVSTWSKKVERLGMDELFVDVTDEVTKRLKMKPHTNEAWSATGIVFGTELNMNTLKSSPALLDCWNRIAVASQICSEIRLQIWTKLGLTVSGGVSVSKLLSKMVASKNKPNLQTLFFPCEEHLQLLIPADTAPKHVFGIGRATAAKLQKMNMNTIVDLLRFPVDTIGHGTGLDVTTFKHAQSLASGICNKTVTMTLRPLSIGVEDSFYPNFLRNLDEVAQTLARLAVEVLIKLRQDEHWYACILYNCYFDVKYMYVGDSIAQTTLF